MIGFRQCRLTRLPHFKGFGMSCKGRVGGMEYVVKSVQYGSPAHGAGVRPEDRIVLVDKVDLIQAGREKAARTLLSLGEQQEVTLLLVDWLTEYYYTQRGGTGLTTVKSQTRSDLVECEFPALTVVLW